MIAGEVKSELFEAIDFFAGSGLVSLGLSEEFRTVWANDNCTKKRQTFVANNDPKVFVSTSVSNLSCDDVPSADLAWASFPCQDLSLAGSLGGMQGGTRSGLFWDWIRLLEGMKAQGRPPSVLVAENVVGFVVADGGTHFRNAYQALRQLGYRVGALVMDAKMFLPQSRKRAFLIATLPGIPLGGLVQVGPSEPFHPRNLTRTSFFIDDPDWVWWSLPLPNNSKQEFSSICERHAPCDPTWKTQELCEMLSTVNRRKLDIAIRAHTFLAGTGYRRTRPTDAGGKTQRLEVRFDGTAGCLRTPNGGSSRQTVLIVEEGEVRSRLMTIRECARLMGAPDSYRIPGTYNDGYRAMGDAVAVPVTRWISRYLLAPLVQRARLTAAERISATSLAMSNNSNGSESRGALDV